jgi:hypothetical protein
MLCVSIFLGCLVGTLHKPVAICIVSVLPDALEAFAHSEETLFAELIYFAAYQVLGEIVESARNNGFTDVIMVHEHRGEPGKYPNVHLDNQLVLLTSFTLWRQAIA